jgi:16S rRNA (guanine(527)-N(7))-methyltransferase RsmG
MFHVKHVFFPGVMLKYPMHTAKNGLKRLLLEFAIKPGSEPGMKLQTYLSLLEKWNPRVNLTSNTSWSALEPLFREGLWAATRYPVDFRTHLDIGSGAGFPAIILRVLNPEMELEMVESRGKKGAFLETIAWELGLTGTSVHVTRLKDLLASCGPAKNPWDCVSWKAVRLANDDLLRLRDHVNANARFWMFHGKEAAVEDAGTLVDNFILVDKLPVPGQKESFLSIYQ